MPYSLAMNLTSMIWMIMAGSSCFGGVGGGGTGKMNTAVLNLDEAQSAAFTAGAKSLGAALFKEPAYVANCKCT